MRREHADRLQLVRLDGFYLILRGVVERIGPPDEHHGRHARFVEGRVIAAPACSERVCDPVGLGGRFELRSDDAFPVDLERLARTDHIQIEHGDGLRERPCGVFHVVPRAEQSLFLAVPGGEEHAAGRTEISRLPEPGDLQQRGDAGSVIVGTVHHRAVRIAPQVIAMGGDDDIANQVGEPRPALSRMI